MESITASKNYLATQEPISDATDEDYLMKLFDQFLVDITHIGLTRTRYYCCHQ